MGYPYPFFAYVRFWGPSDASLRCHSARAQQVYSCLHCTVSWALLSPTRVAFCQFPRALRIHILRLWGPKTILYKAFGLF